MQEENLKQKTKSGLLWNTIERFGKQGCQLLFGIILARLLSPEDYGTIAMPMIFLAVAQVFIDSGFANAIIRKKEITDEDLSTAFIFNICIGVSCYMILFLTSPIIADFYNTPILSSLLKVTALSTLFNPLSTVHSAILTRRLQFRSQAKITLSCTILTGVVGIVMAYSGFGVWSLVFSQTASCMLNTILLWVYSKWMPKFVWSKESFKYLWGYGSKLLGSALLDTTYNNIYPVIIGKCFSAGDLGYYSRAQHFSDLPNNIAGGVLQRVTLPVLSQMQDDDKVLKINYQKMIRISAFGIFPAMVGLAAISGPLINFLLTDKWSNCIILMQLICFARMLYPIHVLNLNLLQVKGRSDLFLRLEIIKKVISVFILVITVPMGIVPMCAGMVLTSVFSLYINSYYTGKLINYGSCSQMKDLLPFFVASMIMFVVVVLINQADLSYLILLILDVIVGALIYLLFMHLLKIEELPYLIKFIRKSNGK